jgi:hypothetical protein
MGIGVMCCTTAGIHAEECYHSTGKKTKPKKKTLFLSLFSLSWSLEDLLYSLALAYLFIFFLLLLVNN